MPWCPQCKNEYREGIRVCADCGCELIPDEEENQREPVFFGEAEEVEKLKKFLEYSEITSSQVIFSEKENVYELSVAMEDKVEALKLAQVFVIQEAERQAKENYEEENVQEEECVKPGDSGLSYESNEQKAKDNKSSAVVLLLTGCAGVVFLILSQTGVLPLHFRGFVYGVMYVLFAIFIIMGFVSFKNSKTLSEKAKSENSLVDSMTKWCLETFEASIIDAEIADGETDENVKYFKRTQWMKEKIQNQFLNLDEAFLEHFIDDIYADVFEEV